MEATLTAEERRIRNIIIAKVRKRLAPMHPPDYLISEDIADDVMEIIEALVHSVPENLGQGTWSETQRDDTKIQNINDLRENP